MSQRQRAFASLGGRVELWTMTSGTTIDVYPDGLRVAAPTIKVFVGRLSGPGRVVVVSSVVEKIKGQSGEERTGRLIEVLTAAFGDLIEAEPHAYRRKFRKMAADPFKFYRGSAPLFYADVAEDDDPWADDRTSRVWIQGDLHAENFGTYMDGAGILIFDVNDFDEAYLGHFTWDLKRLAASLALLAFTKALSDDTVRHMITAFATSYGEQVRSFAEDDTDRSFRLTLESTDGVVHDVLLQARLSSRLDLLGNLTAIEGFDRHFADGPGVRRLDEVEREEVEAAYADYLETIPERKRHHSISYRVKDVVGRVGSGIGSAGLPAYNLLIEGNTQALQDDVLLTMKQGKLPAPRQVVTDDRLDTYFEHQGHRTAVSQRALQANADPWLGWCALRGEGQVVQEMSPYQADIDWDGVQEPEEIVPLLVDLGRATAKVHCVSDGDSDQDLVPFQTEEAICSAIGDDIDDFAQSLAQFGLGYGEATRRDHQLFVDAFRNGRIPGMEQE